MNKWWLILAMVFAVFSCSEELDEIDRNLAVQEAEDESAIVAGKMPVFKKSAARRISGKSKVTIQNLIISNVPGNAIEIINCKNVIIRNCYFKDAKGQGIYILNSENVQITQCYFENVSTAVYAVGSKTIKVINNECKNVKGPFPRGQFAQFNRVSGPGNRINHNYIINELNKSHPEDVINLYRSVGMPDDYIEVNFNYIRGGGPSRSGGGVNLGDGGEQSRYQISKGNVLVNPGHYGIGISGGRNLIHTENKVFSKKTPYSSVGIAVANWYSNTGACREIEITKNWIRWIDKNGYPMPLWIISANSSGATPCDPRLVNGNLLQTSKVSQSMRAPANCGITAWPGPLQNP